MHATPPVAPHVSLLQAAQAATHASTEAIKDTLFVLGAKRLPHSQQSQSAQQPQSQDRVKVQAMDGVEC